LAEADAEARRVLGRAEADVMLARAEAEVELVRQKALAEAEGLRQRLEAEAEGMRKKADAWQHYNSAALAELVIARLPEIATAVAAPLANIDRIVLIGDGGGSSGIERITKGVGEVLAQVPTVVEAMSGIDLGKLMSQVQSKAEPKPEPKPTDKSTNGHAPSPSA
ncbi:MAG TPA: flotillin domain-containing protein, partial [Polyangiaceae bacterium]|nr:flotillin domain-containing protein [Polyangiaceae bacterium]